MAAIIALLISLGIFSSSVDQFSGKLEKPNDSIEKVIVVDMGGV